MTAKLNITKFRNHVRLEIAQVDQSSLPFDEPALDNNALDTEALVYTLLLQDLQSFEHLGTAHSVQVAFHELLTILCRKRGSKQERRNAAIEYVVQFADTFFGWQGLLEKATSQGDCSYQLDREQPWWSQEHFDRMHPKRLDLERQFEGAELEQKLAAEGFVKIAQDSYRLRVKVPIMEHLLLSKPEPIHFLALWIVALTSTAKVDLSQNRPEIQDADFISVLNIIHKQWRAQNRPRAVALPHQPMATLPYEAQGLATIVLDEEEKSSQITSNPLNEKTLLVFSPKLVGQNNTQDHLRKYLEIPVASNEGDELSRLCQALQGMGEISLTAKRQYILDIPRVLAGMFLAASQDLMQQSDLQQPGEFWDTHNARRLTQLVGLNPRQQRDLVRVCTIRTWLETITLSRTYTRIEANGQKTDVRHTAPIIHRLPDEIELTKQRTQGQFSRTKAYLWRIPKVVWDMCTPGSGVESFMLIDERAFMLDTSSSDAFNLYWTIVQRAYNSMRTKSSEDKVSPEGIFAPRISMLYEFAGLKRPSDKKNPHRIRVRMVDLLNKMVDYGLLVQWSSDFLISPLTFDREAFADERVELVLPESLLDHLPESSYLPGQLALSSA